MTPGSNQESTQLGRVLRQLREDAGLTLYELEKRSGIGRGTLTKIENGMLPRRPAGMLNQIARGLGVEPEVLYDAAWETAEAPLPSTGVYFRSKYRLSPEQIAELEEHVRALTKAPSTSDQSEKGGQP